MSCVYHGRAKGNSCGQGKSILAQYAVIGSSTLMNMNGIMIKHMRKLTLSVFCIYI